MAYATSGGYASHDWSNYDSAAGSTYTYGSGTYSYSNASGGASYPSFGSYFIEGGTKIGPTTISIYGSHPTRGQIGNYVGYGSSGSVAYG